jgi:4-phosphopantoate--beta-alanine ligase
MSELNGENSQDQEVPESHPRYKSLLIRNRVVQGVELGITSPHGLIAHGRGEAFDYLIGEETCDFAETAIEAAAAHLLLARSPVISMNGNTTAIVSDESVKLSTLLGCPLEINIFHSSKEREIAMQKALLACGAATVLMPEEEFTLDYIESNRRFVNRNGIFQADCVFVPLEDGDRCEALVRMGKKVIVVDLNPLSRTAQTASVTIVDNVIRALPRLLERIQALRGTGSSELSRIIEGFDNKRILKQAEGRVRGRL